ncbi:alpha-amylase family glycosyl hydrolase [uncultured Lutibacter sp.]|uniref:alpha-amylase family glycosyl hydrolase n=1 Tax=uncultured Lutibacter sp. TaxID=437739 RepID=UPI002639A122|nr:alpha-amylase family glycosyl hydrolase [uncultured Lutibacter sp.]
MKKTLIGSFVSLFIIFAACNKDKKVAEETMEIKKNHKEVVYQVFTRLFGNTNTTNKPWGTIEENGVGKFNDFTDKALQEIKDLGVTYIWYTGVPHHDVIRDYTEFGISNDDPDVVKGRAGSPYAVKDYYNVNPDLAVDPSKRLEEFEALIARTHKIGMKVIIDIVPNHVARNYQGKTNPEGVEDFGASDDKNVEYDKNNNFYYIPGQDFVVPNWQNDYQPLGGEINVLSDSKFEEKPAKWTGNGSRLAQPDINDWYETVKINYGVSPDGRKDFDELPQGFENENYKAHYEFWKDKTVPSSWVKFRDIALYWIDKGVDGFRYDMAEMVPVEFWSYMNSAIKMKNPDAFLLAEVYNPALYRDYIFKGKMDYLYDKVALYDSIKHIMQGHGWTDHLVGVQNEKTDIEHNMLHFLENHDEQRIASAEFANSAEKGKPAMVVSATISTSPTMIYFGQEVGEPGDENAGFGSSTRTSIFDYVGVPHHQRWMNEGKFDGAKLSENESSLRDFYKRLLNFSINSSALMGEYKEIHYYNKDNTENYNHRVFSFVRWSAEEKLIIISNFDDNVTYDFDLKIPKDIISTWNLTDGTYKLTEQLDGELSSNLTVENGKGIIKLKLEPLASLILKLGE